VRTGSELRAALGLVAVAPSERPSGPSNWALFAAAAAVAIALLGGWQLAQRSTRPAVEPTFRGAGAENWAIRAERLPHAQIKLDWDAIAGARTYRVEIVGSDGAPLVRHETDHPSITVDAVEIDPRTPDISFAIRIQAIDPIGQIVAQSGLTPLRLP
jgi:hypothetical protein